MLHLQDHGIRNCQLLWGWDVYQSDDDVMVSGCSEGVHLSADMVWSSMFGLLVRNAQVLTGCGVCVLVCLWLCNLHECTAFQRRHINLCGIQIKQTYKQTGVDQSQLFKPSCGFVCFHYACAQIVAILLVLATARTIGVVSFPNPSMAQCKKV